VKAPLPVFSLLLAAALSGSGRTAAPRHDRWSPAAPPATFAYRSTTSALTGAAQARLARGAWWGGRQTAATGEAVTVFMSETYPVDPATAQRWANHFAGLAHGPELALLTAYVVPESELAEHCGEGALGCYGNQTLVTIGETSSSGVPAASVATHEYGHHVAHNRANPPWRAIERGTKRWSSYTDVCRRAATGSLFPGDQGGGYRLNPGEGFAEAYRVLNETRSGAAPSWPSIVDSTFFPDATALRRLEDDVLRPWTLPTSGSSGGRFGPRSRPVWTRLVATPLDGDLEVELRMRRGALYGLTLLAADGRTILARGLWSGAAERQLRYQVCGARAVRIRVARAGAPGSFSLRWTRP
jgi:hypothetical protein